VRYVLEGSVRKAGSRIRVTAQLVDAASAGHLWAERYDRDLADIFAVQDEITANVAIAIHPAIERSERERAARKPPESLDAWECYHRGMLHFGKVEPVENETALGFFRRATEHDPQFASAYAALAFAYLTATNFQPSLRAQNIPLALDLAGHAAALHPTDAMAHAAMATALLMSGRHAEAIDEADRAVRLDPNSAVAYVAQGYARAFGGRPSEALEPLRNAIRLSPIDPFVPGWLHLTARAHYWAGDYEAAVAVARALRHSYPSFISNYRTLIAALGQTGETDEAQAVMSDAMNRFGERFRHFWLSSREAREDRPVDREHMIDGFRKAGLLEG
jgi:adenylate cyclase